jgi:hypothetical protein
MAPAPPITIEFYGMARRRAGRADLSLHAATLAEALAGAAHDCSGLTGLLDDGKLSSHYLVSVNAGPFLTDLRAALGPGDRVLVISADAGG